MLDCPPRPVLVIDFGAQYSQLIARRVREEHIFSEVIPHTESIEHIQRRHPYAIILSGGPASIYADNAPQIDPQLFELGVPILGICYGFQAMAVALGGQVHHNEIGEFGPTPLHTRGGILHHGLPAEHPVWMSHRDVVIQAPEGFITVASTAESPIAACEDPSRRLAGVQYHPEVRHSPYGQDVLRHFLFDIAHIPPTWTPAKILTHLIGDIQQRIGEGHAICGLSGGVDSAVAAGLVQRAIGKRLTCVFIDHGLLRAGEAEQVEHDFTAATGAHLITVNAQEKFLDALLGVSDPEGKRKIIGREFIRTFETTVSNYLSDHDVEFLVQGTLYPDVVESGGGAGTAVIKSHHNVGGLPANMKFSLIEPLRFLFKDEVRAVGHELGLPETIIHRHPFPGPGLAIRIIGEVTPQRLAILRHADAIVREELTIAGLDHQIWQCPVVLLADIRSVGIHGDERSYGHPIVLRPVSSEDAMTADWFRMPNEVLAKISTRLTNEVNGVNRVVLDITSKPPATIEWE